MVEMRWVGVCVKISVEDVSWGRYLCVRAGVCAVCELCAVWLMGRKRSMCESDVTKKVRCYK